MNGNMNGIALYFIGYFILFIIIAIYHYKEWKQGNNVTVGDMLHAAILSSTSWIGIIIIIIFFIGRFLFSFEDIVILNGKKK